MNETQAPFVPHKTIELITGRVQFAAQRRMLRGMGIKFIESPNGRPLVHGEELSRHALSAQPRQTIRNGNSGAN